MRENETLNILKEQAILLDNLLMIVNRKNYHEKTFFLDMLKHFDSQNFSGFVSKDLYADHSQEFIDEQKKNYSIIKDLSMLLLIQCFGTIKKIGDITDQKMPLSLLKSKDDLNEFIKIYKNKNNKALGPVALELFMTMKYLTKTDNKINLIPDITRNLKELENDEFIKSILNNTSIVNIFSYIISIYDREIFSINCFKIRSIS